ncbi:MAG: plasmid pRiA4b ORF-3 family protein [Verrucomicrobiales bacterium]|nr:plasmid pRiA4b ORF-3 family protein [Verrucomicrobiales bacterium]
MSHQIQADTAQELFQLAHQMRQRSPWKKLQERHFFGICDPDSGQIQTVTVLGFNRRVYALQLFLPEEGIRFWNDLLNTGELNATQLRHQQRMLECEFCDPEHLPEEDIEFYESYGIPNKNPHSLPVFRSTLPHFHPWFLQQDEALLLRNALVLIDKFHREMLRSLDGYYHLDDLTMLPEIPVFHLNPDGDPSDPAQWQVKKQSFPLAPKKPPVEIPKDELFFNRFLSMQRKDTQWEIASYFFDEPLMEEGDDRPYLPYLSLCLDPKTNIPPIQKFHQAEKGLPTIMRETFAAAAENYGYLPNQLLVSSPLAADTFAELEEAYGITVIQAAIQPNLNQIMPAIMETLLGVLSPQLIDPLMGGAGDQDFLPFDEKDEEEENSNYQPAVPKFSPSDYIPPQSKQRYVIRVDLKAAKPPIWRRITLPVDASFFDLHCAIQNAMGWGSMHLHCFDVKTQYANTNIQIPNHFNDAWSDAPSENEYHIKILDVVEQGHLQFSYTYDFGDCWEHKIKIEKTIESDSIHPLPTILTGKGACPPENCGGIWSYYHLLQLDDDELKQHGRNRSEIESIRTEKFDLKKVSFSNPIDCIHSYD